MARNYSALGTDTGATATGTGEPTGGSSRRKRLLIAAAALVVIVVVIVAIAASCGGSDSTSTSNSASGSAPVLRGAHGPTELVNGVPRGYTHDKTGAATAAVNFIQAVSQSDQGRITGDTLRKQAVAPSATPALLAVVGDSADRDTSDGVFNTMPVVTTVRSYDPAKAVISVWALGASQSKVNAAGKVSLQTLWSTTTVTVAWNGQDWQAADWQFAAGPEPSSTTFPADNSPLAQRGLGGFYTVYVD